LPTGLVAVIFSLRASASMFDLRERRHITIVIVHAHRRRSAAVRRYERAIAA